MDDLLRNICEKNGLDYNIIERIIAIEKNNVYKKNRYNIFGDLKNVVNNVVEVEDNSSDNK